MLEITVWPWAALFLLGAVHGANPGMGWLFAVALGLQEGSGRAVWRALPPLMAGHVLAVAAALGLAVVAGLVIAADDLRWVVAACLFGTGVFHLVRHRHPRFGGMRVGTRDLVLWSCLMASAHGAGLMALPFIPAAEAAPQHVHATHAAHADHIPVPVPSAGGGWLALVATLVHAAGYLVVTGAIAALVYYRLGLRLLGRAWVNVDRLWAGALMGTALLVVLT